MELHSCIFTESDCYQREKQIRPRGVMVHSTGANNPYLRRYVQPDDGHLGQNRYNNHWNQPGIAVCVHAFIGRKADGSVATYQTLPWELRGWHCGGSGNDSHISFEICEDDLEDEGYFTAAFREAAELTAHLCLLYSLNPEETGVVLDHREGHAAGIASNHGDVEHWLRRYGKTMDDFRRDVKKRMEVEQMTEQEIRELIDRRVKELLRGEETAVSPWARKELSEAIENGITDGSRPGGYATRQEAAIMVERLRKALEK